MLTSPTLFATLTPVIEVRLSAAVMTHPLVGNDVLWGPRRSALYAAGLDRDGEVFTLMARPLLFQSWVLLLGYGAAAAEILADKATLEERMSRPVVRQGLLTLAPGAFQRFVPSQVAERLRDVLDPFVTSAIQFGAAVIWGREK